MNGTNKIILITGASTGLGNFSKEQAGVLQNFGLSELNINN